MYTLNPDLGEEKENTASENNPASLFYQKQPEDMSEHDVEADEVAEILELNKKNLDSCENELTNLNCQMEKMADDLLRAQQNNERLWLENHENQVQIEQNKKREAEIDSSLSVLTTPELDLSNINSLTSGLSLAGALSTE